MILALLLAQAAPLAPAASAPLAEQRFDECAELATRDPAKAIEAAEAWRIEGGGIAARHCVALAYAAQARWTPAATSFEQVARDADALSDRRAANFWTQAGNARLASNEPAAARNAFDAAIARGSLAGAALGEAHLDRARALVALKDFARARADLDEAVKLVPADPLAWLLSASLARRMDDLPRAQADIAEAARRSPDDASVALEAGNIAILAGAPAAARAAWQGAVANQPASDAGKAAARALAALDADMAAAPAPR